MPTPSVCCCALAALVVAASALAGPLDPPGGPIGSTAKPLGEVEPRIAINAVNTPGDADSVFKITQPGSYYLTGNVAGVSGKHGIEIAASAVTIDLGGFDVVGTGGSLSGVVATTGGLEHLEVHSGTVRGWGGQGVDLATFGLSGGCRLRDLRASRNGGGGIRAGTASVITGCVAVGNGVEGISANFGSVVGGCEAHQNAGDGFLLNPGASVSGCTANSNTLRGFFAAGGGSVVNCAAFSNGTDGIFASLGNVVTGCSARSNGVDGIRVASNCVVSNCTASDNGQATSIGAGIHVTASDNRVDANNCTQNDRGVAVDGLGNFITRNVCSGNTTNWDLSTGNICFVLVATASPPITGNSGGVSAGSNDPNANYTY